MSCLACYKCPLVLATFTGHISHHFADRGNDLPRDIQEVTEAGLSIALVTQGSCKLKLVTQFL